MEFDSNDLKKIGELIRLKRGDRPQSWLAKILETKIPAISNIENGRRPVPRGKVSTLAKALGVEQSQLIPTRRIVKELEGLSVAFRGVNALPEEALAALEKHYQSLKSKYEAKKAMVKLSPAERASEILSEAGLVKPPVDLDKIQRKWNIDVSKHDDIDFPGYVFREKKGKFFGIGIKTGMSPGRTRFTLAHEFGHVFLDHLSDRANARQNCTEVGMAKNELEREADEFAKSLLMPESWIKEVVGSGIKGIETMLTVYSLFDVSRQAAAIRIVELSEKRCAVILSEEGKIKWGVASPRLGAWINRGTKLAKGSQAFKLLSRPLVETKPVKTKSSYWFDGHFTAKFKEHSAPIYKGSTILTLVWEG